MIIEPFYTKAERDTRYQELKTAVTKSEAPARLFRDVTKWTQSESTGQKYCKRYTPAGRVQWRYSGRTVWYLAYNEAA